MLSSRLLVLLAAITLGSPLICAELKLTSYVKIHRPQRYLVSGETTPVDFLECGGGYSDGTKAGLRIQLILNRDHDKDQSSIKIQPGMYLHTYSCTPEMPSDDGFVSASTAYCLMGITRVTFEDEGYYDCNVISNQSGISTAQSSIHLRRFDFPILKAATLSPPLGSVDEGDAFAVSCPVEQHQKFNAVLTVEWRLNGSPQAIYSLGIYSSNPFIYTAKATPESAGTYECVVILQDDANTMIDTKVISTPLVVHYAPRILSFHSAPYLDRIVDQTGVREVQIPYREANSFNCSADGYPRPKVFMSLNGRNLRDLKDIRGHGNAINITEIWTASSGETQEFCCEAINERGQQAKECIRAVVVEVPLNISFFGVEEAKHGCLSDDMNAVLLCRAVGTAALSVTILGPQKAVVSKSRPGKQETNYTFTSDFTKKGLYVCTASDDGHTVNKMYTVCLTGLQGRTLVEIAAGAAGAVVVVLVIAFLIIYIVKWKGRRISNIDIEPGERDRLISRETRERKTNPYTDSQITAVAEIIRYDWQDTFRAIEPPIRDGDRFLQKVKANERGGDDDGDVRSAVRCLEQWSKENPSESFLKAVYKAAKDVAQDLSDRLKEEFECLKPRAVSSNNELTRSTDFYSGKK